jgi:Uma2 family endonuclease
VSLDLPNYRVRIDPPPGSATLRHIWRLLRHGTPLVELLDGTLIDKPLSFPHSLVTSAVLFAIGKWVEQSAANTGVVLGPSGAIRLSSEVVLMPAVSFTRGGRLPHIPRRSPYLPAVPNLVVEVPRDGNTVLEMERKLKEYFLAGVDVVWFVNIEKRLVRVFTSPDDVTQFTAADTLTDGAVLPGFAVPVADLFATLPPGEPEA